MEFNIQYSHIRFSHFEINTAHTENNLDIENICLILGGVILSKFDDDDGFISGFDLPV